MKHIKPIENQEYISFDDEDLIIMDKIQNLPENSAYYSDYILIVFCTKGKIQIQYDNRTTVIHKNEIFLGLPGSILSDYLLSPDFDCKVLAIKPSETNMRHDLQSHIVNSTMYVKSNPVAMLTENDTKFFFLYYNLLCKRLKQNDHHYFKGEIRGLINAFLLFSISIIDRKKEQYEVSHSVRGGQIVEKFVKMVSEDGGCNRMVEYYADKLNITSKHLSTLVRNSLGRTPSDVIKAVTMKEIEHKLRYSDKSIKEISNSLNFPNTSFFGKYFKHHSGMTPNSFRKKFMK